MRTARFAYLPIFYKCLIRQLADMSFLNLPALYLPGGITQAVIFGKYLACNYLIYWKLFLHLYYKPIVNPNYQIIMNPTIQMIFEIVGGALILLSIYGAAKLDRRLFMSGFCFFSILPIIGESMGYNADKGAVHLLVVFLYVVQFIIMFPDRKIYGKDNATATLLASKIGLAVLFINVAGAVFVLCLSQGVPAIFGYYHIALVVVMLYAVVRGNTSNVSWVK
jgi:hypothetical protein